MRRFLIAVVSIVAAALSSRSALAQPWSGGEGLEVRVEDAKGKGVAGAEVTLVPSDAGAGIVFAPVPTDERGRAAIGGLAAGTWQLEVRKPGFMTYLAEVVLGGGKPVVASATHRNVPGATSTLRVRLGRAGGAPPLRQIASAAPAAPPTPAKPAPPAPEVGARAVPEVATPSRPAPATTAVPADAAHPVAMSGQARSPEPSTAATRAPSPVPPPGPIAPAAPVVQPQVPAPAAAPPAPPAPPEVTPLPAAPPVAPRAVVAKAVTLRTCFECRPGETARALDVTTAEGGGGCPADLRARLEAAPTDAWRELAATLPAGCALLEVELSAGDHYTGYRYEASGPRGRVEDCLPGRDCAAGGCRFLGEPLLRAAGGRTRVVAIFESTAERSASFVVYTRPAR